MVLGRTRFGNGVTLIELMIVVAIVAVLAAIAVPNLRDFFIRSRLETAANDLMAALNLARGEAIKRGTNVAMRRGTGSSSTDWSRGWELFVDNPPSGTRESGDELIRVGQQAQPSISVRTSDSFKDYIAFNAKGQLQGVGAGLFLICYDKLISGTGWQSPALVINPAGRIRLTRDLKDDAEAAITNLCGP